MANVIRIDGEVWAWLQSQAQPLVDTPNSVLRRIARLDQINGTGQVEELVQLDEKELNQPWDGEYYYVSFEEGVSRRWNDAQRYGFISAGGGAWYTRTLKRLQPGDRVLVNIPRKGYAGIGRVTDTVVPVDKFMILIEGTRVPITELPVEASGMFDSKHGEHLVAVHWIKTLPVKNAVKEKGFFGNQNTVAKPKDKKWHYTVARLKDEFGLA